MFTYKIYGIVIQSDIFMNELSLIDKVDKVDVTISYGIATKNIAGEFYKDEYVICSKNEFCLYIKETAHYYVAYGNKIVVEPEEKYEMEDIKIFLLGTCLGMLLAQRNTIALHGGTMVINGQGIVITGHTGAGKSTLTSAFRKEGYSFLADDVSAVGTDLSGNIIIFPTYPQQKLCKDAMEKLGYDINDFTLINQGREKYAIPIQMNFINNPVPLKAMYEINIVNEDNVGIVKLSGADKIIAIIRNIYRIELIDFQGFEPSYFKKCVDLAKNIHVYKINRPKNEFSVCKQMELVKSTLNILLDVKL